MTARSSTIPGSLSPVRAGLAVLTALAAASWGGVAAAAPRLDLTARLTERLCRLDQLECVLGASGHGRLRQAERLVLRPAGPWGAAVDSAGTATVAVDPRRAAVERELSAELSVVQNGPQWRRPAWHLAPTGLLSAGPAVPDYRGGDTEPGWLSARAGAQGQLYPGIFELSLEARSTLDVGSSPAVAADLPQAWAGIATHGLVAGFGMRDRTIGPGRAGSLMLTDNARPAPLGSVAWLSPAGQRLGRVRLEAGAGWIPGERSDVMRPGWLLMDLRWLPLPLVELGASRVGIFGGQGRPAPSLGQLILPTDPHVYDDPNRLEPDQDERAALDLRLTLPVGQWTGLSSSRAQLDGLDTVELWWQYGGEDVIANDLGGLPYPSLAGIANLYGAEVAAGPLVVSTEHARILDDYFRWYTGHRVYHEGFTRDGLSMAHSAGGDSLSWWFAAAWEAGSWGLELSAERRLRVGVIESLGDNLLALSTDELRDRAGLMGWLQSPLGWWSLTLQVEQITGADFVSGADGWGWRVAVGR